MNEEEQKGWDQAYKEKCAGKKRSIAVQATLSEDAAVAYDEHWSQIEHYQEKHST